LAHVRRGDFHDDDLLASTEPILPALMKPMLDGSFVDKDATIIRWVPIALVALFVVRGILMFVSGYTMTYVGQRLVMDSACRDVRQTADLSPPVFRRSGKRPAGGDSGVQRHPGHRIGNQRRHLAGARFPVHRRPDGLAACG
jgi:ABC-type multidrug transport system fused ATPase/permease subunit